MNAVQEERIRDERRMRNERSRRRRRRRRRRKIIRFTVIVIVLVIIAFAVKSIACIIMDIYNDRISDDNREVSAEEIQDSSDYNEILENQDMYPDNLIEALHNNPELVDFVKNYPDSEAVATGGISSAEKREDYPLFLQWDSRWGYAPYGDDNIGLSGCAPTCLSMVIFSLTRNTEATPDAIADYSMNEGYYVYGTGTAWELLTAAGEQYGVSAYEISLDESVIKNHIDSGDMLICSMGPGDFTTTGHFIVIYGYNGDGFLINDPYSRIRSQKTWTYDVLEGQIKNLWAYSK